LLNILLLSRLRCVSFLWEIELSISLVRLDIIFSLEDWISLITDFSNTITFPFLDFIDGEVSLLAVVWYPDSKFLVTESIPSHIFQFSLFQYLIGFSFWQKLTVVISLMMFILFVLLGVARPLSFDLLFTFSFEFSQFLWIKCPGVPGRRVELWCSFLIEICRRRLNSISLNKVLGSSIRLWRMIRFNFSSKIFILRCIDEFQWFLILLSVRPGRTLAISAQRFPITW
jgi:hypothetical protein